MFKYSFGYFCSKILDLSFKEKNVILEYFTALLYPPGAGFARKTILQLAEFHLIIYFKP